MNRWQIGYCVTCTNPSCPFPDRKLQATGNCREWDWRKWADGVAVEVEYKTIEPEPKEQSELKL